MIKELETEAELEALKAEKLPAFSGIQLLHLKREIAKLSELIGREGFFSEYTSHNVSHIDAMLTSLEWLIPTSSKTKMTPADWLMTVLAVYFHDLGMIVTKQEFEARSQTGFSQFVDDHLFVGSEGADYKAAVEGKYPEKQARDKFLYQEFVRHTHATRIHNWILGSSALTLGVTTAVSEAISTLLVPLDARFKTDLALVCQSHHLDDLGDTSKYKVSQPYGSRADEVANLQYAAVLLRTADLLHVTQDRTPSIVFRVINPTDPISQMEWAKQKAVKRIRPQVKRNKENVIDELLEKDTIEVHAFFTETDGFFGLTSYLAYADKEIKRSYDWIESSKRTEGSQYAFPWRFIDDTNIEARGFLPKPFSFQLDQAKILDLLTGHTLYNDTAVVLRELVQNALDAIKLQQFIDRENNNPHATEGEVLIKWDSSERLLTVQDNGTGMTQSLIEDHLLKVGSSRYQNQEFRKRYPNFSAISRFGIGVLSCFMIADNVEVFTSHPDEEQGRHLSLRNVHGRYLIKLLDKATSVDMKQLGSNGTKVVLKIRPSIEDVNILQNSRRWIVFPQCKVSVQIDNDESIPIGFESPAKALTQTLTDLGYRIGDLDPSENKLEPIVKVIEEKTSSLEIAYAVRWSVYFKEWAFISLENRQSALEISDKEQYYPAFGTCIEGIRVESGTPGFKGLTIPAIANAFGPNAPKTNVARSNLEATPERNQMLRQIYELYAKHVKHELADLHESRHFSLTWATQESSYLLSPLSRLADDKAQNINLLLEEIKKLPILLVEDGAEPRVALSPVELSKRDSFWTSESEFFRSAEKLLREIPTSTSLKAIVNSVGLGEVKLPEGTFLSSPTSTYDVVNSVFADKEVVEIRLLKDQRRVDLLWQPVKETRRWLRLNKNMIPTGYRRLQQSSLGIQYERLHGSHHILDSSDFFQTYISTTDIPIEGINDEVIVRAQGRTFVLPNNELNTFLQKILRKLSSSDDEDIEYLAAIIFSQIEQVLSSGVNLRGRDKEEYARTLSSFYDHRASIDEELSEFVTIIRSCSSKVFDPNVWSRSST